ncbi:hypothetical protein Droror1_Dr00027451 [Drosera rotundifolia]
MRATTVLVIFFTSYCTNEQSRELANRSLLKEWIQLFERDDCVAYVINSYNKDDIKDFLNFLQRQVRELCRAEHERLTITMLLVGIPNVGKSTLANSLHLIGWISTAGILSEN